MNLDRTWTTFHEAYPKARLECYHYEAHDYVAPHMFELEVLKMLQEYQMEAHFEGTHLHKVEGLPLDSSEDAEIAVGAVVHVKLFLLTIIN